MANATSEERMAGFLAFLQWVVDELGMELKIEKPEDFHMVPRDDLLAIDFLGEKLDEWQPLLSAFKRGEYQFARRKERGKTYIISVLRFIGRSVGYTLNGDKKRTMVNKFSTDRWLYWFVPSS